MDNNFQQNNNENNNENSNENKNEQVPEVGLVTRTTPDGYRRPKNSFMFIIILCLILFFFPSKQSNSSSTTSDEITTTSASSAKINESVTGKFKMSFVEADTNFKDYDKDYTIKNGFKIIKAVFDFENSTDRDQTIEIFECYADDVKCEQFFDVPEYINPYGQSVSAGRKFANVTVYFIVPENSKEIELEYERNSYRDEKFIFIVQENTEEATEVSENETTTNKKTNTI